MITQIVGGQGFMSVQATKQIVSLNIAAHLTQTIIFLNKERKTLSWVTLRLISAADN